jgi:hypothetical protein
MSYMCVCVCVYVRVWHCDLLWSGVLQIGIRASLFKTRCLRVAFLDLLIVGGCYKLVSELVYSRQGVWVSLPDSGVDGRGMLQIGIRAKVFNAEPGWAMLVEIEEKVSKIIVVEVDKIRVQSQGFNAEPG